MLSYNKKTNRGFTRTPILASLRRVFSKNTMPNLVSGFSLIEIIIGASIISVAILAASTAYTTYVQYAFATEKNVQAGYVLEEGLEGVTFLRDLGWNANVGALSSDTPYYLTFNGSYWASTATPTYVDGQFLREFTLGNVNRDSDGRIAASGTNDPNTKEVTVTVSYFQGHGTTTRSVSSYIANLYNN